MCHETRRVVVLGNFVPVTGPRTCDFGGVVPNLNRSFLLRINPASRQLPLFDQFCHIAVFYRTNSSQDGARLDVNCHRRDLCFRNACRRATRHERCIAAAVASTQRNAVMMASRPACRLANSSESASAWAVPRAGVLLLLNRSGTEPMPLLQETQSACCLGASSQLKCLHEGSGLLALLVIGDLMRQRVL